MVKESCEFHQGDIVIRDPEQGDGLIVKAFFSF
jgi:hypothetical protein